MAPDGAPRGKLKLELRTIKRADLGMRMRLIDGLAPKRDWKAFREVFKKEVVLHRQQQETEH